jgi:uncharacterized membrane protein
MDLSREKGSFREFYGLRLGYPIAILVSGVALAVFVSWWDRHYDLHVLTGLDVTLRETRQALGSFATTILSLLGIVLAVSVAVITMVAGSYGPRVFQQFITDRLALGILGVIAATGIYAIVLMVLLRPPAMPPQMGALVTAALALVCLVAFFLFILHALMSLQATKIVNRVGDALNAEIERLYPKEDLSRQLSLPTGEAGVPVTVWRTGYVRRIEVRPLMARLRKADAKLALQVLPGDFVLCGQPIARLHSDYRPFPLRELKKHLRIGRTRSLYQDVRFGFLQLVEIAGRALSPGINEPFTAIACIHRMSEALAILAARSPGGNGIRDDTGVLRLTYPRLAGYVETFEPIRQMAANVPLVLRELRTMLHTLLPRMPVTDDIAETEALLARIEKTIARLPEEDQWLARDCPGTELPEAAEPETARKAPNHVDHAAPP